jgi:hypothetical protein
MPLGIYYDPILSIVYDETGMGISDAMDGLLRRPHPDDEEWEKLIGQDPKLMR